MKAYLLASAAIWVSVALVGGAHAEVDFAKDVKPILENNCIRCHGPDKSKAKLRLDTREGLMKGSESGAVVIAGKPDTSKVYKFINQPKTSEERMPPEGEPLSKKQIETIHQWIAEGLKWPTGLVLKDTSTAAATTSIPKDDPGVPITDSEKAAVAKLQAGGVLAIRLAQSTNLLRVDFSLRGKDVKEDELVVLKNIPNLAELNLGGTTIGDAAMVHLKPLNNVTRLGLQNTKITDVALDNLKGMTKLGSLNLYCTAITDQGIERLAGLKSLKRLYVWQTKVTAAGAKKLSAAVAGLEIERGYEAPPAPPPMPVKPKDPPKKP